MCLSGVIPGTLGLQHGYGCPDGSFRPQVISGHGIDRIK